MTQIDHLVVGAASLEEGRAWMEAQLGLPATGAGKHPAMSTHNALWRVGPCYMEVIAIDPAAPDPGRPRWFGLDDPTVQAMLSKGPRLLTWVARVDDMPSALERVTYDPGPALPFTRDALRWQLTVPEDGHPAHEGCAPALIAWDEGSTPPSASLPDQGIGLEHFSLRDTAPVREAITRSGLAHLVTFSEQDTPLRAVLTTPMGRVILS
ncbi:hypothetical protein FHS89_001443 [Rubricella aquisinus]|uniref:Glyoxalase-like domain-containing protein n=1 Tax=Rubricella aquisinus TaxID=2028108 RepID=A0A840WLM0_9RHOB|nr:VOC family protein [Rubricella aquisinus]MBB5515431.1 hypothetical protein [Rubricella aquisinus]